jgi:hypothetical protein
MIHITRLNSLAKLKGQVSMDVIVILRVGELVRWCSIQAYTLMEERIFESL